MDEDEDDEAVGFAGSSSSDESEELTLGALTSTTVDASSTLGATGAALTGVDGSAAVVGGAAFEVRAVRFLPAPGFRVGFFRGGPEASPLAPRFFLGLDGVDAVVAVGSASGLGAGAACACA